jgi:polyferredoxin
MRNLDNHRYIGEAIQLLQNKGERVHVPLWFKVLDWFLASGYIFGLAFLLYKLITWLLKISY